MFPRSPSKFSYFLFFILSSLANFLLCETIYFEPLHSADSLYLPLLLKDLLTGQGIGHWHLPPSPYLFPDLLLNLILYPLVPFLYLPSFYGTAQMALILLGIFIFLSKFLDQTKSLIFLYLFEILFTVFSLLGYSLKDHPLPFAYFLSGAHHSTGFFFSLLLTLYLYSLLNEESKKKENDNLYKMLSIPYVFFFFLSFILLYISDRFSFVLGVISFFVVRIWDKNLTVSKRISYFQRKQFWILAVFFIFFGELIFFGLRSMVSIPNSFQILFTYLSKWNGSVILQISGAYLLDFSKHIFYQGRSILVLIGFVFLGFTRFPKLNQHLLLVFFPVIVGLLLLVGRFTYLHPYPIRYLFPLWFLGLFGITWVLCDLVPRENLKGLFFLLLCLVGMLFYFPFPREKAKTYFSQITETHVSYDLEKPIRFWSEGRKTPLPVDKDGKPYRWITGAFHTHLTESEEPMIWK